MEEALYQNIPHNKAFGDRRRIFCRYQPILGGNPLKREAASPSETLAFITLHDCTPHETVGLKNIKVTNSVPALSHLKADIFVA
jgi:hypothetical protein